MILLFWCFVLGTAGLGVGFSGVPRVAGTKQMERARFLACRLNFVVLSSSEILCHTCRVAGVSYRRLYTSMIKTQRRYVKVRTRDTPTGVCPGEVETAYV